MMAAAGALMMAAAAGALANKALSLVLFTLLDLLDATLCLVYKLLDYLMEAEWRRPCYCSSARDVIRTAGADILLVEDGGSSAKILRLRSSSGNKLHLDDISDTLYHRASLLSELLLRGSAESRARSFAVNPSVVEMLIMSRRKHAAPPRAPRWSDCNCATCTRWISFPSDLLHVHVEPPRPGGPSEDVLFIHGFISSSLFWTETVFRHIGEESRARYRLFAVDLLGFGRSPKPSDSLYTLREHVEMIERSVLQPYGVTSLHIVAHSLGSILALALAVRNPAAVKSLTLLAPPYFPAEEKEKEKAQAQYVLRKVAPRRVWPPMALGASVACWYEHISRTVCLAMCKNHRFWELAVRTITRNRLRTFLMDGFFCHTHHAAWHTFHNIICGGAVRMDDYLDTISRQLSCNITLLHGQDDKIIPVKCSLAIASRVPRAVVHVVAGTDHLTIVVGRQKAFARQLEDIWRKAP